MKHNVTGTPIGLDSLCREIEKSCDNYLAYKRGGLRPDHLLIPLDSNYLRHEFIEFITDMYKEYGVLSFNSGLDDYVEVKFDGTLQQLREVFSIIDSAAVYTNEFENIIAMDIINVSQHLEETQFSEFMDNCARICSHACVVFFVSSSPSKNEEKLIQRLCERIKCIKKFSIEPFTRKTLCEIANRVLTNRSIEIKNKTELYEVISELLDYKSITTVDETVSLAEQLIAFADFSNHRAIIDGKKLKTILSTQKTNNN